MNNKFIASISITNTITLVIIYADDEIVKSCFIIGDRIDKPAISKVNYDGACRPYFNRHNTQYYIDEFIRL